MASRRLFCYNVSHIDTFTIMLWFTSHREVCESRLLFQRSAETPAGGTEDSSEHLKKGLQYASRGKHEEAANEYEAYLEMTGDIDSNAFYGLIRAYQSLLSKGQERKRKWLTKMIEEYDKDLKMSVDPLNLLPQDPIKLSRDLGMLEREMSMLCLEEGDHNGSAVHFKKSAGYIFAADNPVSRKKRKK
jgi:hypothetical protein